MQEIEIVERMINRLFESNTILSQEFHAWQKVKELAQQHLTGNNSKPKREITPKCINCRQDKKCVNKRGSHINCFQPA